MPIPVMLATAAACGSLVTTMKVGWEFSRMLRQKIAAKEMEEDSLRIHRRLRRALNSGRMSEKEYDYWYDKFLVAVGDRDPSALRRIRTHLRIVYEHTPSQNGQRYTTRGRNRSSSHNINKTHSHHGEPRSRSVRFEPRPLYVPDPPKRYHDSDVPPSAGSIEYFPMHDRGRSRSRESGGSSNTSGEDGTRHEMLGYRSKR